MDRYIAIRGSCCRYGSKDAIWILIKDPRRIGVWLMLSGTKYMEEEFALVTDDGKNHRSFKGTS